MIHGNLSAQQLQLLFLSRPRPDPSVTLSSTRGACEGSGALLPRRRPPPGGRLRRGCGRSPLSRELPGGGGGSAPPAASLGLRSRRPAPGAGAQDWLPPASASSTAEPARGGPAGPGAAQSLAPVACRPPRPRPPRAHVRSVLGVRRAGPAGAGGKARAATPRPGLNQRRERGRAPAPGSVPRKQAREARCLPGFFPQRRGPQSPRPSGSPGAGRGFPAPQPAPRSRLAGFPPLAVLRALVVPPPPLSFPFLSSRRPSLLLPQHRRLAALARAGFAGEAAARARGLPPGSRPAAPLGRGAGAVPRLLQREPFSLEGRRPWKASRLLSGPGKYGRFL